MHPQAQECCTRSLPAHLVVCLLHQNRPVLIRDLPVFGRRVYLKVPYRQFYCSNCQRYFTEGLQFGDWERRYTLIYEETIYERIQASSIAQVSREEGISFDQVQGIFNPKHAQKNEDWGEVIRLSIDEISLRKGHQDKVSCCGGCVATPGGSLVEVAKVSTVARPTHPVHEPKAPIQEWRHFQSDIRKAVCAVGESAIL